MNKIEQFKATKHPLEVWPDVLRYAEEKRPARQIDPTDLERMKWYGFLHRKRDDHRGRDGGDAYMVRIRVTACELTARAAREVAYLAYEFGHEIVDLTTRGNFQIQGLSIEHLPRVYERLHKVGLDSRQTAHDNVRNVFCHPLSGLDPHELIDTRPLCRAIADLILGSRTYSDLPRKFNIAVSGTDHHSIHYWTQDISFLACGGEGEEAMFQLLVGGKQGQPPVLGRHLPVLVAPDQVVDVARALLDLFRTHGDREQRKRARFACLVDRIGISGVLDYLEKHLPFPLQPCLKEPQPPTGYDDLIRWFRQKQPNRWTMGLAVPVGRLTWKQLEGLALLSQKWGDGTLRTTFDQGIMVPGVPTGFKDAAATAAAACGLSLYADAMVRYTIACTGKQFCNIAVTESKAHMLKLMETLRQRGVMLHGIRIHMSGCPSGCGLHHTADIGLKGVRVRRLLGTREGFDIYLGGGVAGQLHTGLPYRLGVDVDQLPQVIEEVIREYYQKHKAGQSFSAYWREVLRNQQADTVGDEDYCPPTWVCQQCDYRFQAEDPPIFCPGCAGLRRYMARIEEQEPDQANGNDDGPTVVDAEGFAPAGPLDAIPDGAGKLLTVAGKEIAVFRTGDHVFALDNLCPHAGGSLAEGTFRDGVVTCPLHDWAFDACTGCSVQPAGHAVARYAVKIEDGRVSVQVAAPGKSSDSDGSAEGSPAVARAP